MTLAVILIGLQDSNLPCHRVIVTKSSHLPDDNQQLAANFMINRRERRDKVYLHQLSKLLKCKTFKKKISMFW